MGGCASLHSVVRNGSADALRTSCGRVRDINATETVEEFHETCQQRWSPLQFAAWLGKADCIQVLKEFGAELQLADVVAIHLHRVQDATRVMQNGSTALHLATTKGHVDASRVLLDSGANVNATDRNGMTPLHWAAIEGHDELVKLLCRRQVEVNYPDKDGATALHLASYEGHLIVVYILLEHGAAVRVVDNRGNTPLHDAAFGGNQTIMHRLLRSGADLAYRNQNGMTAEEIYDATVSEPPVALDVEDSQSTTNVSDTMPATPPRNNPSFEAASSIDACSGTESREDNGSMEEEVTSTLVQRPLIGYLSPTAPETVRRTPEIFGVSPSRGHREDQPPTRDNPFGGLEPSPEMHSGGLLCVRTRSGWTSQTWQSHSEDLDPPEASHKSGHKLRRASGDVTAEMQSLRNELQELHAENVQRRSHIIQELQEMMKQRQESPEERGASPSEQPQNQGWIQAEMDRLAQDFEFKAQVAELLRTTLLKTKVQWTKFQSMTQVDKGFLLPQSRHSSMHDSSKSVTQGQHVELQMTEEVKQMEREIVDLEGHLKLLNDALEDEKQENYELAKDNALLREKASPSEDDEWYEMM